MVAMSSTIGTNNGRSTAGTPMQEPAVDQRRQPQSPFSSAHSSKSRRRSFSEQFEEFPSKLQFAVLACAVFLFFGLHNFLQEAIMNVEGFHRGVMLGYTEVLGVAVCSYLERKFLQNKEEVERVAPLSAYPLLTACLMTSSALSNISLNYINFPTKVVFRSCKLLPTMAIASIIHRKIFSATEYSCAFAVCAGLVLFAAADWELAPSFHPIGLVLVTLSVCADAILPNAQERIFRLGASRLEVTFYTNIFSLLAYTTTTLLSGDLTATIRLVLQNRQLAVYFTVYTLIAYVAISVHMMVVKRFGGVAAVLVATGRKGMTLILSFLFFPKSFSWFYPAGAFLVLGGLLVSTLAKLRGKSHPAQPAYDQHHGAKGTLSTYRGLKQHVSDIELASGTSTTFSSPPSSPPSSSYVRDEKASQ
ncbi:predicted protein [Phaeodactylum tricornutum CCAP 1055/1]|jgi:adenosine 3'-phospho 5'-phosphosulfate transporter B3|uniref:Uncharacterized protein n=2 Tax=Phaeodactylum tricornutum TaxID=2850 RepID=B7G8T2_PHATC|nr:predicted protein [Phaeodactylum tricornutum CCAP 1055/1]EEC45098.1 predicted protein [Phaeodactylum tricornutum CCAP 1055/1]|eukprot:XP_002183398.1 predicted protein [Phaeodactylum tricornutum CCAP 1055/1]